jgi:hypothetical protein
MDMDMDTCVFTFPPLSHYLPSPSSFRYYPLRCTVLAFVSSPPQSLCLLVATYSNFRREEKKTQQQFFVL